MGNPFNTFNLRKAKRGRSQAKHLDVDVVLAAVRRRREIEAPRFDLRGDEIAQSFRVRTRFRTIPVARTYVRT